MDHVQPQCKYDARFERALFVGLRLATQHVHVESLVLCMVMQHVSRIWSGPENDLTEEILGVHLGYTTNVPQL